MRLLSLLLASSIVFPSIVEAQQTTTVILVRHAEQDYDSDERDPILSAAGEARPAARAGERP